MSPQFFFRGAAVYCSISRPLRNSPAGFMFALLLFSVSMSLDARAQKKLQPTIEISSPNYSYPGVVTSFRQLDLKNRETIAFGNDGKPDLRAHLHRGFYEKTHEIGGENIDFMWVKYLGNGSEDAEYAVVYYIWNMWAGSSSPFGLVQLLRIEDSHLKVEQQFLFDVRHAKADAVFNDKSNILTIRALKAWNHCCPIQLDVVQFQLKEGVLKQISYRKVPLHD
jgi:hypothetical protein